MVDKRNYVNFDLTFGLQPDEFGGGRWQTPDVWGQLGIRLLFDVLTPGGRKGDFDGAKGAFRHARQPGRNNQTAPVNGHGM